MSVVGRLVRAELLRLRTTRLPWLLLGGMVLLVLALIALTLGTSSRRDLEGAEGVRTVLTLGGSFAYFFTLALGIVGTAGEERHGTITHTVVAVPSRWPVVVAKLLTYALAGAAFGLVAYLVSLAAGVPGLALKDAPVAWDRDLPWLVGLGTVASAALMGAVGVGLAALLRDQVTALLVGIGWTLVVDSIVTGVAPEVGRFLPGGAVTSLLRTETRDVLAPGLGALVLLGYAALLAALGIAALRRRDLT